MDTTLDRSFPPLPQTAATYNARNLGEWLRCWDLLDVWRALNPQARLYSHYSHLHRLHVRIDHFVASVPILTKCLNANYLGKTHSDHNPHFMTLQGEDGGPTTRLWRLQSLALEDPLFREAVGAAIETF